MAILEKAILTDETGLNIINSEIRMSCRRNLWLKNGKTYLLYGRQ